MWKLMAGDGKAVTLSAARHWMKLWTSSIRTAPVVDTLVKV